MGITKLIIKLRRHTVVLVSITFSLLTVSLCAYATSDITNVSIVNNVKKKDFREGQLVQDRAEQYYKDREALLRRQNKKLMKEQKEILDRLKTLESNMVKEKNEEKAKEKEGGKKE